MFTIRFRGALLVAATTAAIAGCGPQKAAVCNGTPERVAVLAFTSASDLATSQALAGQVSSQAIARAADSCGDLMVAMVDSRPEAELELRSVQLRPAQTTVPNRRPFVRKLERQGTRFVRQNLLEPLATAKSTSGSPFLGAAAKVSQELSARQSVPATVIIIGDGVAIEDSPSGDVIDFRNPRVPQERMDEFVPLLKGLRGSCVLLVGQGAKAGLPAQRIRAAREQLAATFAKAGVGFVATRSRDLPLSCNTGSGA